MSTATFVTGPALAFRSGGRRWAVPISEVREAARVPRLTALPGASPRCAGVALVRGAPVAVLRVSEAQTEERTPAARRLVVVLENRPFALLVDSVDGVEERASDAAPLDLDALERATSS
jgi:chemotaxis signal transduction protein